MPVMLLPYQRKVLDAILKDGNHFVKGEAGTGKSIVLAHAVSEYLARNKGATAIVLTYTNALVAALKAELFRSNIEVMTFHGFMRLPRSKHWDCIFVDEVQDMEVNWANRIRNQADKVLLFGDFGQTLYLDRELVDEDAMCKMFSVQLKLELNVNCRFPLRGQKFVEAMFPDRKLKADVHRTVADTEITMFRGVNTDDEVAYAIDRAKADAKPGRPCAVIFEEKWHSISHFIHRLDSCFDGKGIDLRSESTNDELRKRNIPFRFLGNGIGNVEESQSRALTYVMTWHSSKGLDFETVIIPRLGSSTCRDNPFYVALTRFRRSLVITYSSVNEQVRKALACPFVRLLRRDPATGKAVAADKGPVQDSLF